MAKGKDERSNPNRKVGKLNTGYMSERMGQMFSNMAQENKNHSKALNAFEKNKITRSNVHDVAAAIKYYGYEKTQGGKYADFINDYDSYMRDEGK